MQLGQMAWRQANQWGRAVLDALLPPQCLTCDAPVLEPGRLCATCFNATQFISQPCCCQCGVPFEIAIEGGPDGLCAQCRETPPPWREARAAFCYDDQSRRAILPLKHADRTELAAALARIMVCAGRELLDQGELLIPVPLHRSRLRRRRYNQAALLAAQISRISHVPVCRDAMLRLRATGPLGALSANARLAAVDGVFAVRASRREQLAGRRIILVDDVLTSGATAAGCAKTLLRAGAAQVDVLVAARVTDPRSH